MLARFPHLGLAVLSITGNTAAGLDLKGAYGHQFQQETSITCCDLFWPTAPCAKKMPKIIAQMSCVMTSSSTLKQVSLLASRDVIISSQIYVWVFTLGDGCWLPKSHYEERVTPGRNYIRPPAPPPPSPFEIRPEGIFQGRGGGGIFQLAPRGRNFIRPPSLL